MLTFYIVLFFMGLLFGEISCSFVVYGGVNSVLPLISCSACGRKLRPSECVPILSYRTLNGKCLTCGRQIPKIYPAFELISGVSWLICALIFRLSPFLPTAIALVSVALVAAAMDINTGKIGTMPSVFLLITGIIWNVSLSSGGDSWAAAENIAGFIAAGLILFIAGKIKEDFTDWGDIKLMAAAGFVLGWRAVLAAIILTAAAYFCFRLPGIKKKESADTDIPLGPFLALGILLSLFVFIPVFT